jgi:hypothetical protein
MKIGLLGDALDPGFHGVSHCRPAGGRIRGKIRGAAPWLAGPGACCGAGPAGGGGVRDDGAGCP